MQNFTSRKRSGLLWLHPQNLTESSDCIPFPTNSVVNQSKGRIWGVFDFKMKAYIYLKKNHCWGKTIDKAGSCKFGNHKMFFMGFCCQTGSSVTSHSEILRLSTVQQSPPWTERERARRCEITQTTSWKQHGWKTQLKKSPSFDPWRSFGIFPSMF